jgi:DNA primase large subunit
MKKAEERVKASEILEEDVLKKGMEKINRDEEKKNLKKEIEKKDEENRKMKEDLKKKDEEIKRLDEEIKKLKEGNIGLKEDKFKRDDETKISQQQLKETKIVDSDEKSYNKLFTLYFISFFSFWFGNC